MESVSSGLSSRPLSYSGESEGSGVVAKDRTKGRNIHFYDTRNPMVMLGGLVLSKGITNENFIHMFRIVLRINGTFEIRDEAGTTVERNSEGLKAGKYYVHGEFTMNDEAPLLQRHSMSTTGTHKRSFKQVVRERDGKCVISGRRPFANDWTGLQAAHIFPLAYHKINSVQNGLLLRADIHHLFDSYYISINPDDNYKVVCFRGDVDDLGGKFLEREFIENPARPVDDLLRWHFRQAVLANMKGAGEPIFEDDFEGEDITRAIQQGPRAAERMEFELFSRLAILP